LVGHLLTMSHFVQTMFSHDGNIMFVAVISLLVVILFVLLLHICANWFLAQAQQRRRRSITVSHVLRPTRFRHFHTFTIDDASLSNSPTKGLDPSAIATIPLFVYSSEEHKHGQSECVVCLSPFEENEIGRELPKCRHVFHVECIDVWLSLHSNCPICRAPAVSEANVDGTTTSSTADSSELGLISDGDSALEVVIDIHETTDHDQNVVAMAAAGDSVSVSSPSSSLGCSLKRMLSRNRSERKVFPSSNANEADAHA
jgi:hypothetical protein